MCEPFDRSRLRGPRTVLQLGPVHDQLLLVFALDEHRLCPFYHCLRMRKGDNRKCNEKHKLRYVFIRLS